MQGNHVVCNELPSGTVGWIVARGTVGLGSFVVRIRKVLLFLGLGVLVLGLDFKPS